MSSRSHFRPVGTKLDLHLSLAAIVKELYIGISPGGLGVAADAHFGLLDWGFGEVGTPSPHHHNLRPTSHSSARTCPQFPWGCTWSPAFPGGAMWIG